MSETTETTFEMPPAPVYVSRPALGHVTSKALSAAGFYLVLVLLALLNGAVTHTLVVPQAWLPYLVAIAGPLTLAGDYALHSIQTGEWQTPSAAGKQD